MKKLYKLSLLFVTVLLLTAFIAKNAIGQSANFTANTTTTCVGGTVTFTDASIGPWVSPVYEWNFGQGASPALASGVGPHTVTYNTMGTKTVSLTITDGSDNYSRVRTNYITVNQPNAISLTSGASSNIQTVCINSAIAPTITYATTGATGATFIGLPPGVTGNWSSNLVAISGTPTIEGSYHYTVTLTGGCGTTSATGSITVNPLPVPTLSSSYADNTFCAGTSVTFTAGGGTNYNFRVNGVSKQNSSVPTYTTNTLLNGNIVDVVVTSPSACLAASAGISNTVHPLPTPIISGPTAICGLPSSVIYSVPFNFNSTYNWAVTGGTISAGVGTNAITVDWTTIGSGTVSVTESFDLTGCTNTSTVNITKAPASVGGTLSGNNAICAGSSSGPLTLNGFVGNIIKWQYSNDLTNWSDTVYVASSFNSLPLFQTTYFRAIVQSGACAIVSSTTVTLTVNPIPTLVITNPAAVCAPLNVNITLPAVTAGSTSGLALTYWTNPAATLSLSTPMDVAAGTYYIKGTGIASCFVIKPVVVVVHPKPNLSITANTNPVCFGEPLQLRLTGQENSIWKWVNPDTTNVNPVTIFPQVGPHIFKARASNSIGCKDSTTISVQVLAKPSVTLSAINGLNACVGVPKIFNTTVAPAANYTYKWFVNGVEKVGAVSPTFSEIITGTAPVKVKVQARNTTTNCSSFDSVSVVPVQSPVLNMSVSKPILCRGDQTFITLSSTSAPPVYFAWGDGLLGNLPTRGFAPRNDTIIRAESINATGCITRDSVNITVRDTLVVSIGTSPATQPVCMGSEIIFSGPVGAGLSYQWFVNGVAITGASNPTFTRSFSQNSIVKLTVTVAGGGCSGSAVKSIIVINAPIVDLGPPQTLCEKSVVTLQGPTGAGFTYKWFKDAETTPLSTDRILNYTVPSTNSLIRLEASSSQGCTTIGQLQITKKSSPVISVTANNTEICSDGSVTLSLSTSGATSAYWWDFASGNINPRQIFPIGGDITYHYWAEAVNAVGCSSRDSVAVRVNNPPLVPLLVAGGSTNICLNADATITGPTAPGYSYHWFIDNVPVTGTTNQLVFKVTKNVVVKLQVTDTKGCVGVGQTSITARILPGILLSPDSVNVCVNESVTLTINNQNISSFTWWDNLAGNSLTRSVTVTSPGLHKYWANGINSGCISLDTAYLWVFSKPQAVIIAPSGTTICKGQTMTLSTPTIAGTTNRWFINGVLQTNTTSTLQFVASQNVLVKLTVTNVNGCQESDEINIVVEDAPEFTLGGNRNVCTNSTLTLSGPQNANYTYAWFVNNVLIQNTGYQYSFKVTQAVTVRLRVSFGNCSQTDQITVTPLEIPIINVTASSSEICLGSAVTLQLSTQNASSFIWWDGFGGNLTQRSVVPLRGDTTYVYWAEAINGLLCKAKDSVLVKVNKLPEVPITVVGGSNVICFNAMATVRGPQVAGHSYQWFIDDVAVGSNHFQHSFKVTKDVVVKLRVTNAKGCVNNSQIAIQMINPPGIILSPDSVNVCLGNSYTLTINDQNVSSFSWGDGLAGHLKVRSFTPTVPGHSFFWAEGINASGCISRDTTFIRTFPKPNVTIVPPVEGNSVCKNTPMVLSASQTTGFTYQWTVNNSIVGTTPTYSFTAQLSGLIKLRSTDANGCVALDSLQLTVRDAPIVDLGPDQQVCLGYTLPFTAPAGANLSYLWYVNNVQVSTTATYSYHVTQPATIRLVVSSTNGCVVTDEVIITTKPSPQISVVPSSSSICIQSPVTLQLTTNGSSFVWWDGLGGNLNLRTLTPYFADSTYVFWGEAIGSNGCKARDTAYVSVRSKPQVQLSIQGTNNTFCEGAQATVLGPVQPGYNYQWFIDAAPAGANFNRLTFTVRKNTVVKLLVTNAFGCRGVDSINVFMHTAPGVILSPDSLQICLGESATLTVNTQNVTSFAWFDGLAGNLTSRTFTPSVPDLTYIYWAEGVNSLGCISRDTSYVIARSVPVAQINAPNGTAVCRGSSLLLQAATQPDWSYEWIIGNTVVSELPNFEFTGIVNSNVILRVSNQYRCTHSTSIAIIVRDTPQINLGSNSLVCMNTKVTYQGPVSAGYTYAWFVNGLQINNNTYQYIHTVTGPATIRLQMNTSQGCAASGEVTVGTLIAPTITLNASSSQICSGQSVVLQATVANTVAFNWWDGFTGLSRTVLPTSVGTHKYWARATSTQNCTVTDTLVITVRPRPVVSLQISQGASTVCVGTRVSFSVQEATGALVSYVVWNKVDTVQMGSNTIRFYQHTFTQSKWFHAELVSPFGCSRKDSLFITTQPLPLMTISRDTTVCRNQIVTLKATGGASCIWSDASGIIGTGYSLPVMPQTTRKYYARVINSGALGCSKTDSVVVSVLPIPTLSVQSSAQTVCGGNPVILSASGAVSYTWSTGQTGPVITVIPHQTTTYSVTGVSANGCTGLGAIAVNVNPAPVVKLNGLKVSYCLNDEPTLLSGTPAGGVFSGNGVVGGVFRPLVAGVGTHQVIYSLINQSGCYGADTVITRVYGVAGTINLGPNASICPHEQIVLDAGPGFTNYFWSTGDITRIITVKGNAYFPGTTRKITVIATIQDCSIMGSMDLTIKNNCYIGIDELEKNAQFTVVPNPSTGEFVIQHKDGDGAIEVAIYDGRGLAVYRGGFENCSEGGSKCRINLAHLPKGVYMVSILKGKNQFTRKLVLM